MTLFSRAKIEDQAIESSSKKSGGGNGPGNAADFGLAGAPPPDTDAAAVHLQMLGLSPGATWEEIIEAHARLVSDLTPGPGASHRNVSLAEQFLSEVNQAFASLRMQAVA